MVWLTLSCSCLPIAASDLDSELYRVCIPWLEEAGICSVQHCLWVQMSLEVLAPTMPPGEEGLLTQLALVSQVLR